MHTSHIRYRSSLALDFLCTLLKPDGLFFQHPVREEQKEGHYNILYHLQTVSVLLTGGQYFQKKNVSESAHKAFQFINNCEFESHDSLIFVYDEKSLTTWNALAAILCFKQDEVQRGIKYIRTIVPCIEKKRVHPYIRAITSPALNKKAEGATVPELGVILLALLMVYKLTGDYLEQAKWIGNQISSGHLDYSGYNAWGLTLLAEYTNQPFYLKRRDMMARAMRRISTSAMTSLFAAITQQTLNACEKPDEELLQYQCELQVDPKNRLGLVDRYEGAFVRKKRFPEIRVDYTVHNILSFMQYLNRDDIYLTI